MNSLEAMVLCSQMCPGEFHHKKCPVAKILRDSYCTPREVTERLPLFSLDPCSNPRSHVPASMQLSLQNGDDGLAYDWSGHDVFVNGPFSKLRPWTKKAGTACGFVYLVNLDPTTAWMRDLYEAGGRYRFEFSKRLQYETPPRIQQSSNPKPSCLVANNRGRRLIGNRFDDLGQWLEVCNPVVFVEPWGV